MTHTRCANYYWSYL